MSGEDDGTILFKRLGMTTIQLGPAAIMRLEAELTQLRAENNQLRKWNKELNEALQKALLPKQSLV